MKFVFAGDSWAAKGFTENNYQHVGVFADNDVRLPSFWPWPYEPCIAGGQGNLQCLDKLLLMRLPPAVPVIWVYTEPCRDYGRILRRPPFEWMQRSDFWQLRDQLNHAIISEIRTRLPNPVAFIGGLSDVPAQAESQGFTVLHASWQRWIAQQVQSQHFEQGWGAADVGWRAHHNGVTPGAVQTLAWDEQIKEWCAWEQQGYFCHEHPTPRANQEFAEFLQPRVERWLNEQG